MMLFTRLAAEIQRLKKTKVKATSSIPVTVSCRTFSEIMRFSSRRKTGCFWKLVSSVFRNLSTLYTACHIYLFL